MANYFAIRGTGSIRSVSEEEDPNRDIAEACSCWVSRLESSTYLLR